MLISITSCSTVPITERKQLSINTRKFSYNRQAAKFMKNLEKAKLKLKVMTNLNENKIKDIGKKMEEAVSAFFEKLR